MKGLGAFLAGVLVGSLCVRFHVFAWINGLGFWAGVGVMSLIGGFVLLCAASAMGKALGNI